MALNKPDPPVGIKQSLVSPAYLKSNSTSHVSVFSAIAELIDNASDTDVKATEIRIRFEVINGEQCITFTDNGSGLNADGLHKMLSFGYSEKPDFRGGRPIGQYGNGFKSGSMRIAKDALVLTVHSKTCSVGMLSRTYHEALNAKTVYVPMVTWNRFSHQRVDGTDEDLKAIFKYSLYNELEGLKSAIQSIRETFTTKKTGTRIILWNLLTDSDGTRLELDCETNIGDFINRRAFVESDLPHVRSLKEYCSILYLKPHMKIFIQDQKVLPKCIAKSLSHTFHDAYKPLAAIVPLSITIGYQTKDRSENEYGMCLYYRNRLIIAYEKIGCQIAPRINPNAAGVVIICQPNHLEVSQNKQDFSRDERFKTLLYSLKNRLKEYIDEVTHRTSGDEATEVQVEKQLVPDQTWVQCNTCLKWRRLPFQVQSNELPDEWHCKDNPDFLHNNCDAPEEQHESDEVTIYCDAKPYKKLRDRLSKQSSLLQQNSSVACASDTVNVSPNNCITEPVDEWVTTTVRESATTRASGPATTAVPQSTSTNTRAFSRKRRSSVSPSHSSVASREASSTEADNNEPSTSKNETRLKSSQEKMETREMRKLQREFNKLVAKRSASKRRVRQVTEDIEATTSQASAVFGIEDEAANEVTETKYIVNVISEEEPDLDSFSKSSVNCQSLTNEPKRFKRADEGTLSDDDVQILDSDPEDDEPEIATLKRRVKFLQGVISRVQSSHVKREKSSQAVQTDSVDMLTDPASPDLADFENQEAAITAVPDVKDEPASQDNGLIQNTAAECQLVELQNLVMELLPMVTNGEVVVSDPNTVNNILKEIIASNKTETDIES